MVIYRYYIELKFLSCSEKNKENIYSLKQCQLKTVQNIYDIQYFIH